MQNVGRCNSAENNKSILFSMQSSKALFVGFTCCNNLLFVVVVSNAYIFALFEGFCTRGVFRACRVGVNTGSLVIWLRVQFLPARMRHLTEMFKGIHSYPGA